jgi:hypothetical protein
MLDYLYLGHLTVNGFKNSDDTNLIHAVDDDLTRHLLKKITYFMDTVVNIEH